jgi:N-acetylglucosaminyl-diphospho-decaprenol L-rhamnosyltransferase
VEWHKGVGLARYFRKRAEGATQQLVAWLLSPVIVCTALARPMMWRLRTRN